MLKNKLHFAFVGKFTIRSHERNETIELAQLVKAESAGKPLQIFELIIFN